MKAEPKVLKHSMALEIVSLQYCRYTVGLSGVSLQYCRYTVGLSGVSSGNLQKLVPVSFYSMYNINQNRFMQVATSQYLCHINKLF